MIAQDWPGPQCIMGNSDSIYYSVSYFLAKLSKICETLFSCDKEGLELSLLHKNVNISSNRKGNLMALTAVYQFELYLKIWYIPSQLSLPRQGPWNLVWVNRVLNYPRSSYSSFTVMWMELIALFLTVQPNSGTPGITPRTRCKNSGTPGMTPRTRCKNSGTPGMTPRTRCKNSGTPGTTPRTRCKNSGTPGMTPRTRCKNSGTPGTTPRTRCKNSGTPGTTPRTRCKNSGTPGMTPRTRCKNSGTPGTTPRNRCKRILLVLWCVCVTLSVDHVSAVRFRYFHSNITTQLVSGKSLISLSFSSWKTSYVQRWCLALFCPSHHERLAMYSGDALPYSVLLIMKD